VFNQFEDKGQLAQVIQRRLNMTGSAPAPSVAPELFPVLNYENDRPEWGFCKNERLCSCIVELGANVGEFRSFQLYLPTTATSIAVVTSIISHDTNVKFVGRSFIAGGIAPWTAVPTGARDFRYAPVGSVVLAERASTAAQPTFSVRLGRLQAVGETLREPIILGPGGTLMITGATANQTLFASVHWYERAAMPGELG